MRTARLVTRAENRLLDIGRKSGFLPQQRMASEIDRFKAQWASADPFPHICVDNFFDQRTIEIIADEFPGPEQQRDWVEFRLPSEWMKNATASDRQIPFFTRQFLYALNSRSFVAWLEELTDIWGLIADTEFMGGGLHATMPGGKLGIHTDFNKHLRNKLDRRLNLLLFLNRDWEPEWGGQLELWDREVKRCGQKITPLFNRLVIFATTDFTFHGHPQPVACPPETFRKSIALYYYSNGRPTEEQSEAHLTQYREPPSDAGA
ncbi:MAG: 2OG-Fe(II) oxygenase [Wenzhouxiangellaceae bacterium]|nr:2OG-Fe(II) oxygenase [Wenzhouxiangellaceae bacterium]